VLDSAGTEDKWPQGLEPFREFRRKIFRFFPERSLHEAPFTTANPMGCRPMELAFSTSQPRTVTSGLTSPTRLVGWAESEIRKLRPSGIKLLLRGFVI
jgi:hypothetical protein